MKNKAFTLIELLVVVAIIGILAAVGVVAYNGYTASAKKTKCLEQSRFFEKELIRKWTNGQLQNTPDVGFSGNYCFLYWIPSNAYLEKEGSNIIALRNSNKARSTFCVQNYQGVEHTLHDHFYGMGYRNPFHGSHGSFNTLPGLDTPARGNTLREGGSVLRCGANAGLSDPYKCKLITMCEKGTTSEKILETPR